jgi:aminopeptidase N
MQGGMEFPALVMISDKIEGDSYHEVIIHETAHQWWAIGVGNNEIEYAFLDEGLTEYSVVMFYENHADYGYSREQLMNISETTYKTYCSIHEKLFGNVDTSMVRSLKDFKSEYEYVNLAYVKSCIMYDNLRDFVGDENFYKCLKKYYSKYCYANAMPQDLIGVFEDCNSNVEGFFDSFLNGKVIL